MFVHATLWAQWTHGIVSVWPEVCVLISVKVGCCVQFQSEKTEGTKMGKYLIAWLLGVPAGLLLLIYVVTHLF